MLNNNKSLIKRIYWKCHHRHKIQITFQLLARTKIRLNRSSGIPPSLEPTKSHRAMRSMPIPQGFHLEIKCTNRMHISMMAAVLKMSLNAIALFKGKLTLLLLMPCNSLKTIDRYRCHSRHKVLPPTMWEWGLQAITRTRIRDSRLGTMALLQQVLSLGQCLLFLLTKSRSFRMVAVTL